MGTYVTDTGFEKKTLAEIKAELEAKYQEQFGDDIDLDPTGVIGQLIGIESKYLSEQWDALEELYTCRDPNHATGTCLDNIVAENAITRLAATATTVNDVLLEGTEGTIVAADKKAKQTTNSILYSLNTSVTITATVAAKGVIEVDSVAAGTYRVTIDSTNYDYIASGGEAEADILNAIEALITAGTWTGTATVASDQLTLYNLTTDFSFSITGNLGIEEIWSKGNFTCDETGANLLPASSLVEIVTPVSGWNQIINPSVGLTGRALETDAELRLRRQQSIISGNATDEAIRSNVLNNVTGVTSVQVFSNRTDAVDGAGRPAHSFETVVEGGDDDDVAEEIWLRMPSGIETYGNVNGGSGITIQDSQGKDQIIKFSRPENVYIFIRVRRNFYSEESYPTNGDEMIKDNIVAWSLIRTNIDIGKDVIEQRLGTPVYGVPGTTFPTIAGIEDIEITMDSSTSLPYTPSYASGNITISDSQLAVFATDQIEVALLP